MGGPGGGAHELRLAPNAHPGKGGAAPAFGGGGGSGGRGCGGGGGGGGQCLLHAELQERRVQGHHDEDLPLFEEDLVPPLLRGLPQRRSRLDVEAVLGGEGHEGGDVASGGVAVMGGGHVGGGGDIRVRELVPRLSTRHDDRTRHLKQVLERIGDTVLHGVNKLFNKGTSQPPGFGGLGLVPLRKGGVLPLFLHRFHIEHQVKMLRNLVPPPPNFFHLPPGGLAVLREKNIAVDCVAEAVHEVASHRGGWAVSLHGGVSGGIRGGVLQGCRAQRGLGRNEEGGSAIPRYQPSPFILWRVGTVISGMWSNH